MSGGATSTRRTDVASRRSFDVTALPAIEGPAAERRPVGMPPNNRVAAPGPRALVASARDLPEAIVSVGALLVMLALGVVIWIAIGLAVALYVGVALLRPQRSSPGPESIDSGPSTSGTETRTTDGSPDPIDAAFAVRYGLTPREMEILPLLAQRMTDREIAERLFKSPRTVMNQTASILGKLGLESRREVAAFAARHGLVFPPLPPNVDG